MNKHRVWNLRMPERQYRVIYNQHASETYELPPLDRHDPRYGDYVQLVEIDDAGDMTGFSTVLMIVGIQTQNGKPHYQLLYNSVAVCKRVREALDQGLPCIFETVMLEPIES